MKRCYCRRCERNVRAEYSYGGMTLLDKVLCVVTLGFWLPIALMSMWLSWDKQNCYVCPRCENPI